MEKIFKKIQIALPVEKAFTVFIRELDQWWPKEYTWSQEKLKSIKIEPFLNGLCTEVGPYGFRCDWGRVTAYDENQLIKFKWQISPQRAPEPDPEKASDVAIGFKAVDGHNTAVELLHSNFENHGEGASEYQKAMGSPQGWDHILHKYIEHAKSSMNQA